MEKQNIYYVGIDWKGLKALEKQSKEPFYKEPIQKLAGPEERDCKNSKKQGGRINWELHFWPKDLLHFEW